MIEEEGLDNVYERHARLARATQAGLKALGFELYAREGYRSNTVTSALPPQGLTSTALRKLLNDKYGVVIAGGQSKMTGKMIRVGHLGRDRRGRRGPGPVGDRAGARGARHRARGRPRGRRDHELTTGRAGLSL